jgi:hypothetical protein
MLSIQALTLIAIDLSAKIRIIALFIILIIKWLKKRKLNPLVLHGTYTMLRLKMALACMK